MSSNQQVFLLSITAILSMSVTAVANSAVWKPLLSSYCFDCHGSTNAKGEIDLESASGKSLAEDAKLWEKALRQLQSRQMPPIGKDRPSETEYVKLVGALENALDANAAAHPNPGRTDSLRRLTRSEYQNAIRDLLAVEINTKLLFPADHSSHGFDNVTVGELSPALLDRYITAAQKISRLALGRTGKSPDGRTVRVRPDITQENHIEGLPLGTRGGILIRHTFVQSGEYDVRIHLMRDRDEKVEGINGVHELQVLLNGEVEASFKVKPPKNRTDHTKVDAYLFARINVNAGVQDLGVTFVKPPPDLIETLRQPYQSAFNQHRHPRRSPAIYQVSITGPFHSRGAGNTASRQQLFRSGDIKNEAGAKEILRNVLRQAYRGRANQADLTRAMGFYREGSASAGFEFGLESALSAVLVSPKFLFRVERDPEGAKPGSPYALNDLDLASRLSFFLWSSIPDDALLDAAAAGKLSKKDGMAKQVLRMLADARASSLVKNFVSQWLYLRNLDSITPDGRLFPDFDDNLRQSMRRETELFFESVLRENRSVLDLLRSNHTFLNERLAKHYGVPHVYGERFRRVSLDANSERGGILRHGSILTVTSYATRTSPVLRGHWVLKNMLGTPPPPPPPDVPALDDNTVDHSLTVRKRLAAHRENRTCARCHDTMDPIGFAFENFDAVGQWRTREGEQTIDARGSLPDGTVFEGIAGLETGLLKRPEIFVRTLTEKLLVFALGRGIEPTDAPAVRQIVRGAALKDYRFSAIIMRLVTSDPFAMRMTKP